MHLHLTKTSIELYLSSQYHHPHTSTHQRYHKRWHSPLPSTTPFPTLTPNPPPRNAPPPQPSSTANYKFQTHHKNHHTPLLLARHIPRTGTHRLIHIPHRHRSHTLRIVHHLHHSDAGGSPARTNRTHVSHTAVAGSLSTRTIRQECVADLEFADRRCVALVRAGVGGDEEGDRYSRGREKECPAGRQGGD